VKNAMQLKALMKNIAKEKNIPAQVVLQNYMFERLLERIAKSKYRENFIIKGGFLISAIVGLDTRTTMDIDATIKGMKLDKDTTIKMFKEICEINISDKVVFEIKDVSEIRESEDYTGLRIAMNAIFQKIITPLKLDLTTGDKITPREVEFEYKLFSNDQVLKVLSYNKETILAEKLETIVSRGVQTTRPRDYYDVYILHKLVWDEISINILKEALLATARNRESEKYITNYKEIFSEIKNDNSMINQWDKYRKSFSYANNIVFNEVCETVESILDGIFK